MSDETITVYGFAPQDRSGRVRWLLEEMGVEYQSEWMKYGPEGSLSADFRKLSPLGKMPAVRVGEHTVFETGAALEFLASREGEGRFHVAPGDRCRAAYLSWSYLLAASFDPLAIEFVRPDLSDDEREARLALAAKDMPRYLDAFEAQLDGRQTLLARGFTTLDIQLTACLGYAAVGQQLEGREALQAYMDAHKARPAAKAAGLFEKFKKD